LIFTKAQNKKIVCYFVNWSQYRPDGGKFLPENVNAKLCTHIIFAFAKVDNYRLTSLEWNDESDETRRGMYQRIMDLKMQNPRLKILLSCGGLLF
jgi:chitinase